MYVRTDGGMASAGFQERNDCAVRALALFKQIDYKEAHAAFAGKGRRQGRPTPITMIRSILGKPTYASITLRQLANQFPKGRVYAIKRGHAFTLIDGVLHDTWKVGPKSRVNEYWLDTEAASSQEDKPIVLKMGVKVDVKKASAKAIYDELKGTMSSYAIAKQIAARMNITVANANYYVTRVFK